MSHPYTDTKPPTFPEAAKQITLIFTLDLSQHGDDGLYALIRPMPRSIASIERSRLLLAIGEWKCQVVDGREALIRVRAGETSEVRQTRRLTWSFKGLDRMDANILDHGSPYPKTK